MLKDTFLQDRYIKHLKKLIDLAEKEVEYTKNNETESYESALMYRDLFVLNLKEYTEVYEKNLIKEFAYFQKKGNLELIDSYSCLSSLFQGIS
jgi:1,4-alpha-glucan branching enzyme